VGGVAVDPARPAGARSVAPSEQVDETWQARQAALREVDREDEHAGRFLEPAGAKGEPIDALDPMTRALFASGLRPGAPTPSASPTSPADETVSRSSRVSLEHVLHQLVRRISWSGDARAGSARLELGAGALAGATLTIHSDDGHVRVALELPPGVDAFRWKDRIAQRLGARGLLVESLEVS
jgi:hypothetical protein